MSPMEVTDGTPPTQHWVPQSEPLDLNEPLGFIVPVEPVESRAVLHLEDLDPAVQHRIESWPEAVALLQRAVKEWGPWVELEEGATELPDLHRDATAWLAANAPEESS